MRFSKSEYSALDAAIGAAQGFWAGILCNTRVKYLCCKSIPWGLGTMYSFNQKILFRHCDPAGIVFYPCYFEMINDVVEDFFETVLDYSFSELLATNGIPTAQIDASFSRPSRLSDLLSIQMAVTEVGRSSMKLNFEAQCEGELRFSANSVLVYIDGNGRSTPWPESIKQKLEAQVRGDN